KSLVHTVCEQGYCVQARSTGLEPATTGSTVRKIRVLLAYQINSYGNRQSSLHQRTQKLTKSPSIRIRRDRFGGCCVSTTTH
ncbi:MAG: hypothetical protein WCH39_28265, partial [Schlesneria sp.]